MLQHCLETNLQGSFLHFVTREVSRNVQNTEESIIRKKKSHYLVGGGSGNDWFVMFLDCFVLILFFQEYFKIFWEGEV